MVGKCADGEAVQSSSAGRSEPRPELLRGALVAVHTDLGTDRSKGLAVTSESPFLNRRDLIQ